MKNLLLTLLLGLASHSAMADWTRLLEGKSSVTYIDSTATIKESNLSRVLSMTDFVNVQDAAGEKFMSIKAVTEYDCQEKRYRTVNLTWYSSNMGKGNAVLSNNKPDEWQAINPTTGREAIWELVCD